MAVLRGCTQLVWYDQVSLVWGSNSDGGVFFSTPVQTGLGAHAASSTMGTGSLLGVEWPGPRFKKVELYLYFTFTFVFRGSI